MNDLEKLNIVIGSLEEQARQVDEFNGVLRSVNEASVRIEESKTILNSLAGEHQLLLKNQNRQLEDVRQRIAQTEDRLIEVQKTQHRLERKLERLDMVSSDQFHDGQNKLISILASLDLTIRNLQEEGRQATQDALNGAVEDLTQQVEAVDHAQRASFLALRGITLGGVLVLAAGTAFIAFLLLQ